MALVVVHDDNECFCCCLSLAVVAVVVVVEGTGTSSLPSWKKMKTLHGVLLWTTPVVVGFSSMIHHLLLLGIHSFVV